MVSNLIKITWISSIDIYFVELATAVRFRKEILVIRDHDFFVPHNLPEPWKPYEQYLFAHRCVEFNPVYLMEFFDKVKRKIEKHRVKVQHR